MQQQYQQLHNRQHQHQRHDENLQHKHEYCPNEPFCEDSKQYLTSTQIAHRFIPPPLPLATENVTKYISAKPIQETDPRAKGLPFETTTKLYHDRKIIERNPSEYYNLENVVDCHPNSALVTVQAQPQKPFASSEYADRFKTNKTLTVDVSDSRPDQRLDNLQSMLTDAASKYTKDVGPDVLDVMCDVTSSNEAIMKLLHPYISVYDFDFDNPHANSPFVRYKKQVLNSYLGNVDFYSPFLKTKTSISDPLSMHGNRTSLRPPHFGALQITPKQPQHVPNFGLISEARDMFVDPRKMLDQKYRRVALYSK